MVSALEVADHEMADLPGKIAGLVLVALGSSARERGDLAQDLAGRFRRDMVAAVESAVHRVLLELGTRESQ